MHEYVTQQCRPHASTGESLSTTSTDDIHSIPPDGTTGVARKKIPLKRWLPAFHERGPRGSKLRGVAHALACHYNNLRGDALPSQVLLADRTSMDVKDVRVALQRLEAEGWITSERRARQGGGQGWRYVYFFTAPVPEPPITSKLKLRKAKAYSGIKAPITEELEATAEPEDDWCECGRDDCQKCNIPF